MKLNFDGTSHGSGYSGTISQLPLGFSIDVEEVNRLLKLRKCGYGRSVRQHTERDVVEFFNGLDNGIIVDDIQFQLHNRKHSAKQPFTAIRPNHADWAASVRYGTTDLRLLSERASARNSVGYVIGGAIAKQILQQVGITTTSHTLQVGDVVARNNDCEGNNEMSCLDSNANKLMMLQIDNARANGDSLGGKTVVVARGVPAGIGDTMPYSKRIDGIIAGALMSIPSVKAVEIGLGTEFASIGGRQSIDKVRWNDGVEYITNNCGGVTGGITNGADIVVTLTVKPIPTVPNVDSVDISTGETATQMYERADTCVVPNVGTIAECVLAMVLLDEIQHSEVYSHLLKK